jgi:sigma-B regulation protein RsbU (phosphoserine phosphatase)
MGLGTGVERCRGGQPVTTGKATPDSPAEANPEVVAPHVVTASSAWAGGDGAPAAGAGSTGGQVEIEPDAGHTHDAQLRDLQAVTDAALSRLGVQDLLMALLDRMLRIVAADTATVLLLDPASGMLAARASRGIEEEVRQGVRIPVGVGFAGTIAADRQPLMIDRVDGTTVTNPILWEHGVQVMLGVPLLAAGELLGVLHVGRRRHDPFSAQDAEILSVAAERAAGAIQTEQRRQAQAAAAALIENLQPGPAPSCPGFEFASRYVPAEHGSAGGDWYDLFLDDARRLWIIVGDVAGHGLGAAMVMSRAQTTLRAYTAVEDDPAAVLERADRSMLRFDPGVMVTAVCAVMPPPYHHLRLATAGHPPPVMAERHQAAELLALPVGPPLGFGAKAARSARTVPFARGATAVFYTDGLIERPGEPIQVSLDRLCHDIEAAPAERVCRDLVRRHIAREPLRDDAALVAVHALPD